jgi:hypothetical protein
MIETTFTNSSGSTIYKMNNYSSIININDNHVAFPQKLFHILMTDTQGIIEWLPNGKSFRIYDNARFSNKIIPQYFKQSKLASFQRQLNLYGFRRILKGEEQGAYFHSQFMRDRPDLVADIKRIACKSTHESFYDANQANRMAQHMTAPIKSSSHTLPSINTEGTTASTSSPLASPQNGSQDKLPVGSMSKLTQRFGYASSGSKNISGVGDVPYAPYKTTRSVDKYSYEAYKARHVKGSDCKFVGSAIDNSRAQVWGVDSETREINSSMDEEEQQSKKLKKELELANNSEYSALYELFSNEIDLENYHSEYDVLMNEDMMTTVSAQDAEAGHQLDMKSILSEESFITSIRPLMSKVLSSCSLSSC